MASLVEDYWFLEAEENRVPSSVLPDGRMELVFHFGCRAHEHRADGSVDDQPSTLLVGQMDRPVWLSHQGRLRAAGIRLRPGAARALLHVPASEFARRIVDSSDVVRAARDIPGRLSEMADVESQVDLLESFLDRLSPSAPLPSSDAAVAAMERSHGRLRVSRLAGAMGIDRRALERAFQREVGLSPKAFARIVRFQHARQLVSSGCALATAALASGYYDQAHMTSDFVELGGASPAAWRKRPEAQLFPDRTPPEGGV